MSEKLDDPRKEGLAAAQRYRLPFGSQTWRGHSGNWVGAGIGSSIDFQDHRDYQPGDDPRYIHWAAYARSGQLTMKLYRAEVSPMVDLAVDVSRSMSFKPEKAGRVDALLTFCCASAMMAAAPVRIHAFAGEKIIPLSVETVQAGKWRERVADISGRSSVMPTLPWRHGAMKILLSDLLFPGDPSPWISRMAAGGGLSMLLVPALAEEAEAPDRGNVELIDCESDVSRIQRVDEDLRMRFKRAYQRHFGLWEEACRRRGVGFSRIGCEGSLVDVLGGEPRKSGVVELRI